MLRFAVYPTGRPAFVDPHKVSAVFDLIEMKPASIRGADPMVTIIGTTLVVDGAPVHLAGDATSIAEVVAEAQRVPFPRLDS